MIYKKFLNLISLSKKCFYWVVSQVSAAKHPNSGKTIASLVKSILINNIVLVLVVLISVFLFFGMCQFGLLATGLFQSAQSAQLASSARFYSSSMQAGLYMLRQFISCFASKPLAYCMKRDSESDHSDGSPQKRSRISQNENIGTEQPITLEEVSKMPEICLPKVPGESSPQWQTEGKADMKPYLESTSQVAANANLEEVRSTVSEAQSVPIPAINPESIESIDGLKLTVQTTLDIVSDIASGTTKVMEAAIATEAVKNFTVGRGATKEVALACGAVAGVSVLLTDERVKKVCKDFVCYQIDTVTPPRLKTPWINHRLPVAATLLSGM